MENKEAQTDFKIYHLLRKRWSPKTFDSKEVENEKLQRIFEAARWSPSSRNEQPWRFILGIKGQGTTWGKIFDTLEEGNKAWAKNAPVLVLAIAKKRFSRNNKENESCAYDLGQAVAHMSVQAVHENIYLHQMGGFKKRRAILNLDIPDVYSPKTAIALGYLGEVESLPENMQEKENSMRTRKKATEFVFENSFGGPSKLYKEAFEEDEPQDEVNTQDKKEVKEEEQASKE